MCKTNVAGKRMVKNAKKKEIDSLAAYCLPSINQSINCMCHLSSRVGFGKVHPSALLSPFLTALFHLLFVTATAFWRGRGRGDAHSQPHPLGTVAFGNHSVAIEVVWYFTSHYLYLYHPDPADRFFCHAHYLLIDI